MMSSKRYVLLDGMRGIAALSIMVYHLWLNSMWWASGFNIVVDFFFVLSGFVLAPSLVSAKTNNKRNFILKRLVRLFPMIIMFFLALIAIKIIKLLLPQINLPVDGHSTKFFIYVGAFFLLQIFYSPFIQVNVPLWSLSAEMFVNLLAIGISQKFQREKILFFIAGGIVIEFFGLFINKRLHLGWGVIEYLIAVGRVITGFYIGQLLHKNLTRQTYQYRSSGKSILLYSGLFFLDFYLFDISSYFILFSAPICYFLIRELAMFDESILPRKFQIFCAYMGRVSYGIYVWHLMTLRIDISGFTAKYFSFLGTGLVQSIVKHVLSLILVLALTEFSIRLMEQPIRKFAGKKLSIQKSDRM
jgi:peptidoglycan/LPS O-acetylase OafA/YrhL